MRLSILMLVVLATACTPAPSRREVADAMAAPRPPLTGATEFEIDVPPDLVLERVATGLRVRGFTITDMRVRTGSLEANSTGPATRGWADCPWVAYRLQSSRAFRGRRTEVGDVTSRVSVRVDPVSPTAARVGILARHVGSYVDSLTNTPRTTDCTSTGALEEQLIAAVRAGAG
jgi:hypothetical protein